MIIPRLLNGAVLMMGRQKVTCFSRHGESFLLMVMNGKHKLKFVGALLSKESLKVIMSDYHLRQCLINFYIINI